MLWTWSGPRWPPGVCVCGCVSACALQRPRNTQVLHNTLHLFFLYDILQDKRCQFFKLLLAKVNAFLDIITQKFIICICCIKNMIKCPKRLVRWLIIFLLFWNPICCPLVFFCYIELSFIIYFSPFSLFSPTQVWNIPMLQIYI